MGGIGFGDVKLLGVCGAFLGYKLSIILLLLSIIIGGIFACFLLAVRYKNKKYMPFAPFITVAYILILFYEERLVDIFDKYYGLL